MTLSWHTLCSVTFSIPGPSLPPELRCFRGAGSLTPAGTSKQCGLCFAGRAGAGQVGSGCSLGGPQGSLPAEAATGVKRACAPSEPHRFHALHSHPTPAPHSRWPQSPICPPSCHPDCSLARRQGIKSQGQPRPHRGAGTSSLARPAVCRHRSAPAQ